MGIYGDMLGSFPELSTNIHCWYATPKVSGGYDIQEENDISGILLNVAPGSILSKKDYDGYALDAETEDLLWVPEDEPVRLGMFLYHPYDGTVCRVVRQYDKSAPGGYKRFVVERVQGSNGINEDEVPVSDGVYL